jgi:hypothetical protein
MAAVTLEDRNRRDINFNQPQVDTLLPEHFQEQYPTLVTFLKKYYDYLELAAGRNRLDNIFFAKDNESTNEDFLDYLFFEKINGLGADRFDLPRLTLKLVSQFSRAKGTEVSIPAFFRYIFGVDAEAFYPKTQMFTVGESQIGADSLRFLQDSRFWQVLSIQIKSPLSTIQWNDIYKRYNHIAGFALFAETQFETVAGNISAVSPLSIADTLTEGALTLEATATEVSTAFTSSTGVDSDETIRFYTDRSIEFYQDSIGGLTAAQKGEYTSIADVLDTNSPTFSSNDSDKFSDQSLQTMDEDLFTHYDPNRVDSA